MTQNKNIIVKNIYYMLSYAFQVLRQSNFEDVTAEEFDNIHNLFAAILSRGISQQLKQGLYREYINHAEDMPVMRGKIDMPGTVRNRIARKQLLRCEYDELSVNTLLNQILKTTAEFLLRSNDVDGGYKDALKKELLFFTEVDTINPTDIRWTSIRFHRNNQTYQMLISICQLILEGMLLTTDKGQMRLASFVDEQHMCHLYEKFILEYYRREFPTLHASSPQIDWDTKDEDMKGNDIVKLPIMQTDVMLSYQNRVLIIDAKYYSHTTQTRYDVHALHSGNLYQIFAYVKNYATNKEKEMNPGDEPCEVSGMLLYARTTETIQPNNTYHMSGNRIDVKTLDLNQEFSVIAGQLDGIAKEFFGIGE